MVVCQLTILALSDALKIQEYVLSYGTDVAGVLFNEVRGDADDAVA